MSLQSHPYALFSPTSSEAGLSANRPLQLRRKTHFQLQLSPSVVGSKCRRSGSSKRRWSVVASANKDDSKEVNLDAADLMALEFGRRLGESKEKTLSKVVQRKLDPDATYIGLEKKVKKGKDMMNVMNSSSLQIRINSPKSAAVKSSAKQRSVAPLAGLPDLASPPVRNKENVKSSDSAAMPLPSVTPTVSSIRSWIIKSAEGKSLSSELLRKPPMETLKQESSADSKQGLRDEDMRSFISDDSSTSLKFSSVSRDNDSIEVSKHKFQRMLDESFNSSSGPSLVNLVSPPAREKRHDEGPWTAPINTVDPVKEGAALLENESDEAVEGRLEHKPFACPSKSGIPSLASPPLRKGSLGLFHQKEARATPISTIKATPISTIKSQNDINNVSYDDLLRKPSSQQYNADNMATENDVDTSLDSRILTSQQSEVDDTATQDRLDNSLDGSLLRKPTTSRQSGVDDITTENVHNTLVDSSALRKSTSQSKVHDMDNEPLGEAYISSSLRNNTQWNSESAEILGFDENQVQMFASSKADEGAKHRLVLTEEAIEGHRAKHLSQQKDLLTEHDTPSSHVKKEVPSDTGETLGLKLRQNKIEQNESGIFDSEDKLKMTSDLQTVETKPLNKDEAQIPLRLKVFRPSPSNAVATPLQSSSYMSQESGVVGVEKLPTVRSGDGLGPTISLRNEHANGTAENARASLEVSDLANDIEPVMETLKELSPEITLGDGVSIHQDGNFSSAFPKSSKTSAINVAGSSEENTERTDSAVSQRGRMDSLTAKQSVDRSLETVRRPSLPKQVQLSESQVKDLGAAGTKWHQAKVEEEQEWARAETLLKSQEHVIVKIIGSNRAGLSVSFGCLVGFLPIFELSPKRGIIDFSSWAQQHGSNIRTGKDTDSVNSIPQSDTSVSNHGKGTLHRTDMTDLRDKYNEEISKLLSSFVGEKVTVLVKSVDKDGRRLKFSEREADPQYQEVVQKKAELLNELQVGDVVSCEVKNITPIGVFVELHGVSALIHRSEISWHPGVDPASFLTIGEVIKAQVCRLDRMLQRINLSLKSLQPDPLKLTLESVVGNNGGDTLMYEAGLIETEMAQWPELEVLVNKLEQMENIVSVSKGRCLRSAALAPSFQVFLSTPQDNGYKLLVRFEKQIQEVLVSTPLDREKMKEYVRLCTTAES